MMGKMLVITMAVFSKIIVMLTMITMYLAIIWKARVRKKIVLSKSLKMKSK